MENYWVGLLVVVFVLISVLMILVVLIQRPQGGGLSGAFGAASEGAGQTALGVETGDVLTTATIGVFLAFLGLAIGLNYVVQPPRQATPPSLTSTDEGDAAEDAGEAATTTSDESAPAESPDATDEPPAGGIQIQGGSAPERLDAPPGQPGGDGDGDGG